LLADKCTACGGFILVSKLVMAAKETPAVQNPEFKKTRYGTPSWNKKLSKPNSHVGQEL
jgi:hypothetical protein